MDWVNLINKEMNESYLQELFMFVDDEYKTKNIFPPRNEIFKALENTSFEDIKVVILGQDPYPTYGYANGLAFSVNDGVKIPQSLVNIYKEINNELGIEIPTTGNLELWSKKGILLLNRILTVEEGKPLSHKNKGWEILTLKVIEEINKLPQKIVFILLGNEARKTKQYLDNPNHLVLETSHPSPLGAYKGFFGSGIFRKTIDYLGCDKSLWSVYEK